MSVVNRTGLLTTLKYQLTGNDASRMQESSSINKSLSVLGQVVHSLNQGAVSFKFRVLKVFLIASIFSHGYLTETPNSLGFYKMP
jgi:hypothetical protein